MDFSLFPGLCQGFGVHGSKERCCFLSAHCLDSQSPCCRLLPGWEMAPRSPKMCCMATPGHDLDLQTAAIQGLIT